MWFLLLYDLSFPCYFVRVTIIDYVDNRFVSSIQRALRAVPVSP